MRGLRAKARTEIMQEMTMARLLIMAQVEAAMAKAAE
jgi:hypothetical protein